MKNFPIKYANLDRSNKMIKYKITPAQLALFQREKIKKDIHFFQSIMPSVQIFLFTFGTITFTGIMFKKYNFVSNIWNKTYLHILDLEEVETGSIQDDK